MEPNEQDVPAGAGEFSSPEHQDFDDSAEAGSGSEEGEHRPRQFREDRQRRPPRGGRGRHEGDRRGRRTFDEGPPELDARLQTMIQEAEAKLSASHEPVHFEQLTPFERKQIHQHFERRKMLYETKTYPRGEDQVLWVFPVANLKKFAEGKAQEALERGEEITLPAMSSYERFIVHNILKEFGSVATASAGEGEERHIVIRPNKFGRSLRKIVKKIKLF